MNFFCQKEHLQAYQAKINLSDTDIFCLGVNEGLQVAKKLFSL